MVLSFDRPVGSTADVAELEYVSALHQTASVTRQDGSLDATDVRYYLCSRFGVDVSLETVRQTILQGLGGSADTGEVIDLMELVAILTIPYLVKTERIARGQDLPSEMIKPKQHVMKHVCNMIVHDALLNYNHYPDVIHEEMQNDDDKAPRLSTDLIQRILRAYGEEDLASNETLVQDMMDQVAGHERLDADALLTACTADVRLYDPSAEVQYATTYQTVMGIQHGEEEAVETNGTTVPVVDKENEEINEGDQPENIRAKKSNEIDEIEKAQEDLPKAPRLERVFFTPAIDSTADTFWSKSLVVLLWAGVLFSYFGFSVDMGFRSISNFIDCPEYNTNAHWDENGSVILCSIGNSVVRFFITFASLCFFGIAWMGIGSMGNNASNKKVYKPLLASVCLIVVVIVPDIEQSKYVAPNVTVKYLFAVAIILTVLAILLHWMHAIYLCLPSDSQWRERIQKFTLWNEVGLKASMSFKINQLIDNAVDIHCSKDQQRVVRTCFGHALHVYSKWKKTERVGSLLWVWREIWSGAILSREGITYSARLVAANISQYVVVLFVFLAFVYARRTVGEEYDKESALETMNEWVGFILKDNIKPETILRMFLPIVRVIRSFLNHLGQMGLVVFDCDSVSDILDVCPDIQACTDIESQVALCGVLEHGNLVAEDQIVLLTVAGMDVSGILEVLEVVLRGSVDATVNSLYPEEVWMLTIPLTVAMVVAVLCSSYLAAAYIPSITSTTLKLRTGVIPTLGDKMLDEYRVAPDTVTLLTGSLFWGCLFAGILLGAFIGLVIFLFLWQASLYFTQKFIAIGVGILVIGVLRYLFMFCGRLRYFRGFYRSQPGKASIYFLAMDWANFGLAAGFVFVRMVKLLVVSAFSVGRIDTDLLAKGVGQLGPYQFDPFPTIHTRELMLHDAHRHPYIELLGTIYLMKLRYGTRFASSQGSCWRLIFVYALMPWMQRYRIFTEKAPSQDAAMDFSITEDDLSSMKLDKVAEKTGERSSFFATPALLKSDSRNSFGTFSTLKSNLNSVRTENEILMKKIDELEASKREVTAENVALRKKLEELERLHANGSSGGEHFDPFNWFKSN